MGAGLQSGASSGIALGGLDFGLGMAGISLPPSGPGAAGFGGAPAGYGGGFGAPQQGFGAPQQQQQPFGGAPAAKPAAAFNPFDM
jgi:hypothetical protein